MKTDVKSLDQKTAIAKQRHDAISGLFKLTPNFSCQGKVGHMLDNYILCEVIAKKVLSYYKTDLGGSGSYDLRISTLKSALNHFKAAYEEARIDNVFKGGGGTKGKKSARQLRNGYIHNLYESDKVEIELNHGKLIEDINHFHQLAKELFDNVSG